MTKLIDLDDTDTNTSANPHFEQVLNARLSRRNLLRGGFATTAAAVLGVTGALLTLNGFFLLFTLP